LPKDRIMKSIEESVVIAMDGSDKELLHILQDLLEIGADPDAIIKMNKEFSILGSFAFI